MVGPAELQEAARSGQFDPNQRNFMPLNGQPPRPVVRAMLFRQQPMLKRIGLLGVQMAQANNPALANEKTGEQMMFNLALLTEAILNETITNILYTALDSPDGTLSVPAIEDFLERLSGELFEPNLNGVVAPGIGVGIPLHSEEDVYIRLQSEGMAPHGVPPRVPQQIPPQLHYGTNRHAPPGMGQGIHPHMHPQ